MEFRDYLPDMPAEFFIRMMQPLPFDVPHKYKERALDILIRYALVFQGSIFDNLRTYAEPTKHPTRALAFAGFRFYICERFHLHPDTPVSTIDNIGRYFIRMCAESQQAFSSMRIRVPDHITEPSSSTMMELRAIAERKHNHPVYLEGFWIEKTEDNEKMILFLVNETVSFDTPCFEDVYKDIVDYLNLTTDTM